MAPHEYWIAFFVEMFILESWKTSMSQTKERNVGQLHVFWAYKQLRETADARLHQLKESAFDSLEMKPNFRWNSRKTVDC